MSEQDDNFLARWSRRKALVRQGVEPAPAAVPPAAALPAAALPAAAVVATPPAVTAEAPQAPEAAAADTPQTAAPAVAAPPRLTLDDVEALTPESDFSRFIARDVDPSVKNSAMKKLFTDPHYNVMDGLDIYISDYNTPDPLPKSMLRQLVQARMLGLLDDELPEQPAAEAPVHAPPPVVAEVEVEVERAAQDAEAANDGPASNAGDDAPRAGTPALPAAGAADPPFAVPRDAAHAVSGDDANAVAGHGVAQPGPGSSSRAS